MSIILGVDPGTNVTGYAILEVLNSKRSKEHIVHCTGTIQLHKLQDPFQKLGVLANRIARILKEYNPDILSIESPFIGNNIQSALKLGRAQGVIISECSRTELIIAEYAPKQIKNAVTGNGNASKEQVKQLLIKQLDIREEFESEDASDALAVAFCHASNIGFNNKQFGTNKKAKSWSDFASNNPDRIK